MTYKPTLGEWNWHVIMLNQALIGAISDNFRMVSLKWMDDAWTVKVVLKIEDAKDEEEAFDVADETSFFIEDIRNLISTEAHTKIHTEIIITDEPIQTGDTEFERRVFLRKEANRQVFPDED